LLRRQVARATGTSQRPTGCQVDQDKENKAEPEQDSYGL